MNMHSFPKVELHLHLDCSTSYEAMTQLVPGISREEYERRFVAPEKVDDLAEYLVTTVNSFELMQTERALRIVTLDLIDQLKRDHVIYGELRFAPLQHLMGGLAPERVVEVVAEATQEGMARTGVVARLLLCTLRHFSEEQSLKTVELLRRYHGVATDGVVAGLDIAADEAGFSLGNHKAAYRIALDEGLPRTAHAGEARGPESVWETLETLRPTRIGHGVRSIEDRGLVEHLAETGVHLEVCPTCNVQIDIYPTFEAHPVDRLFKAGVSLGVNTDARTTTPTTLSADYGRMHDVFGWGKAELLRANQHALRSAFVGDEALRTELGAKLIEGYA